MKKYSILIAVLGVFALGIALTFGAAFGAGITYFMLQADSAQAAFVDSFEVDNDSGVLVSEVKPESAAADAGLMRGDLILTVNDEPVNTTFELQSVLSTYDPGDFVDLKILHGDDIRILEVQLDDAQGVAFLGVGTCDQQNTMALPSGPMGDMFVEVISPAAEIQAVIPDSPADEAGLLVGDLILSVDGTPVGFEADLADLVREHSPGDTVRLSIIRTSDQTDDTAALSEEEVAVTLGEHPDDPNTAYLGVAYGMTVPHGGFHGGTLPFSDKLPEDWDGEGDMPPFFFDIEDEFHGQLPDGWEDDLDQYLPHADGMPHFFDLGELPEGIEDIVIIAEVLEDTPADEAGLQVGDLIIALDGEPLESVESFIAELQSFAPGDQVTITIFPINHQGEESISPHEIMITLSEHPDDPEKGFLGVMINSLLMTDELHHPEGFDQDFEFQELPDVEGGDA